FFRKFAKGATRSDLNVLKGDLNQILYLDSSRLAARAAGARAALAGDKALASEKWKESDRIRDELAAQGIILKDNKDGTTTWEVKR
ncbi:MAG: CysS/YqeB C-terminal domain-containing protein, partial [Beijerinckiaceae bacterium]